MFLWKQMKKQEFPSGGRWQKCENHKKTHVNQAVSFGSCPTYQGKDDKQWGNDNKYCENINKE